jgi:sugar-phosphatase
VAEEDASRGKPDPEGFLLAARRLQVEPGRCVVIEDAPAGVAAAKAGEMFAIGVTTTHPGDALREADLVVASLEDVAVTAFIERC